MNDHAPRMLYHARTLGPVIACVVAAAIGFEAAQHADLFDAVLRGAGAWIGTMLVWWIGVGAVERVLNSGIENADTHNSGPRAADSE